jgi:hypothetical protein
MQCTVCGDTLQFLFPRAAPQRMRRRIATSSRIDVPLPDGAAGDA